MPAQEHFSFGCLKGSKDLASDLERVFDSLEPGSNGLPFVVAKIRMSRACGKDEVVVVQQAAIAEMYAVGTAIDAVHFAHQDSYIVGLTYDIADGLSDVGWGESGGCNLIEEGLKCMVIFAVDDSDDGVSVFELQCRIETGKASAYDQYAFATGGLEWARGSVD